MTSLLPFSFWRKFSSKDAFIILFVFVKHYVPLKHQETDFNSCLGTVNTEMESGWNIKKAVSFSHKK